MNIVTVTLNPAIDIHMSLDELIIGQENYVSSAHRRAGGKGVNVSRTLKAFGLASKAVIAIGKDNSREFISELQSDCLDTLSYQVYGAIRENINIHAKNGIETRINREGFALSAQDLDKIYDLVSPDSSTIVALCGRLPKGISKEDFALFFNRIKSSGALTVLDSSSLSLADLASLKPWLIKPNITECSGKNKNKEQLISTAKELCSSGVVNVMISLGGDGAIYASSDSVYTVGVPSILPLSTVGAGDSTIAGFIAAYSQGYDIKNTLALACATGTASCLTIGTEPPMREDIDRILKTITLNKII